MKSSERSFIIIIYAGNKIYSEHRSDVVIKQQQTTFCKLFKNFSSFQTQFFFFSKLNTLNRSNLYGIKKVHKVHTKLVTITYFQLG